jgi:hypothetical protein
MYVIVRDTSLHDWTTVWSVTDSSLGYDFGVARDTFCLLGELVPCRKRRYDQI